MRGIDVDVCERCGAEGEGRRRWMFYRPLERFPRSHVGREFYCLQCWRVMRVYAIVGFSLLGLVVGGIVGASIWLMWF